ncbi:skin secretory protein xP2-like [Lepus europaeus]|uniref:skin secretory protein xP2-like n=1 Tax=Lepus europaeus TaxID=9983 RepID=UPI002B46E73A|nr:skin secretory protein xP2-like [Lepus europaeus]
MPGPHYGAACRRGERSRALLYFPASSCGSEETKAKAGRVRIILTSEPYWRRGRPAAGAGRRTPPWPPPPCSSGPPRAASARQQRSASLASDSSLGASQGLESPLEGAGRGGASAQGGASASRGARRELAGKTEPSRAEPSEAGGAGESEAEPGRNRSPRVSRGAPAAATEGTCQPSPARLSRPAPLHLPIALRSREGTPPEGAARAPASPYPPARGGRPARRNFHSIPLTPPRHPTLPLLPSPRSHKGGAGGEAARAAGTGLRAAGAGRQKENCLCSRCPFGAACPSAACPAPRASSLPPPSAAAPPPWSRAGPAVLWDPASLRGARRCWWLGL